MYIVKNTGTMVIGVANQLHTVDEEEMKMIESGNSSSNGLLSTRDGHLF